MVVHDDLTIHLDACSRSDLRIGPNTGGDDDQIGGQDAPVGQVQPGVIHLCGAGAGVKAHAVILHGAGDALRGLRVHLAGHDPRIKFHHGDGQSALLQAPCGFQPKHAAADDHGGLRSLGDLPHAGGVIYRADGNDIGTVTAFEGRNEAARAQGVHQLVIGEYVAVCEGDGFLLRVDGSDGTACQRDDVPARRVVPGGRLDGDVLGGDVPQQLLGQRRTVVGESTFAGDHNDQPAAVVFADGLCGGQGSNTPAEDQITSHSSRSFALFLQY